MKINIERSNALEVCRVKVINLSLVKSGKEGRGLTHRIRNGGKTTANLKLRGHSHFNKRQT